MKHDKLGAHYFLPHFALSLMSRFLTNYCTVYAYDSAKSGLIKMKSLGYQLLGFIDILDILCVGPLNIEKMFIVSR